MNVGNHTVAVLFFIAASFISNGQNKTIDSLERSSKTQKDDTNKVNTFNELALQFLRMNDYENSEQNANNALSLGAKLNFKKGQAIAYRMKGYSTPTLEVTLHYFDSSIQFAKESKDLSVIYYSYLVKGQICRSNEKFNDALHSFLEAVKLAELLKNKNNTAYAYMEVGGVYLKLGNTKELLRNYEIALKLFSELNAHAEVALCYLGIGDDFYNKTDYDSAEYYLKKGLLNVDRPGANAITAFTPDQIKGFLLLDMGKVMEMKGAMENNRDNANKLYVESEKNYLAARLLGEEDRNVFLLPEAYLGLGSLYLKQKKISDSKRFLDSAFQMFNERQSKEGLKQSYLNYSTYDSIVGNFKKAYEDHKLYMQYFKEIKEDSNIRKAAQLEDQFEYDKREAIAKAEREKKDADIRRVRNLQYSAIAIVLLVAIFFYWISLQRQKAKTRIEEAYSDLKSTQQQLIQSEKMASLGELTAGIAHEIQNPLNFVNNFSEVNKELIGELVDEVDKGHGDEAKQIAADIKENSEKINHHGKRADAIVKGMLQHSRVNAGQKEPTDINALCDEYLRLAYHGLRAKDKSFNAEVKTDFDDSVGKINIIPQDIGRVILNLINNAFYAVSEKKKQADNGYEPTVTVATAKENGKIEVKVKDNGNGIPLNVVDKIFQPFFTTKPTGQGTGLGLSLAYDIVKAHGGEIKVTTRQGEGSEFIIGLPG